MTPSMLVSENACPVPGSKVLVADDDSVTRSVLPGLLSKRSYEVIVARDGISAYELLQNPDAPALAIIDWMMPGLDGIELCRRLRQSPRHDLTGLFNRGAVTEVLRREFEHASRDATPTSLILADVDHFKQVNDVYRAKRGGRNRVEPPPSPAAV